MGWPDAVAGVLIRRRETKTQLEGPGGHRGRDRDASTATRHEHDHKPESLGKGWGSPLGNTPPGTVVLQTEWESLLSWQQWKAYPSCSLAFGAPRAASATSLIEIVGPPSTTPGRPTSGVSLHRGAQGEPHGGAPGESPALGTKAQGGPRRPKGGFLELTEVPDVLES